jgi:hypothetical protein
MELRSRLGQQHGTTFDLADEPLDVITAGWRPFRTWVSVLIRATSARLARAA